MSQITINSLDEIGSASPDDFLIIWDTSAGATRKIKVSNLLDSSSSGGLSSGVPEILRGNVGQVSETRAIHNVFGGLLGNEVMWHKEETSHTVSATDMFKVNSVVTGSLDSGVSITKAAGDTHVYVNNKAISVGGPEVKVQHPTQNVRMRSIKGKRTAPLWFGVQCTEETLILKTKGWLSYSIQVYS